MVSLKILNVFFSKKGVLACAALQFIVLPRLYGVAWAHYGVQGTSGPYIGYMTWALKSSVHKAQVGLHTKICSVHKVQHIRIEGPGGLYNEKNK